MNVHESCRHALSDSSRETHDNETLLLMSQLSLLLMKGLDESAPLK